MWTVLAYVLVTFGFAVVWHLLWFRSFYDRIGYFGEQEPVLALGFASIAIQALVIGLVYPLFRCGGGALVEALRVAVTFDAVVFSSNVVSAAAKHHAPATMEWFLFEGLFFAMHAGLSTLAFAWVHRSR